MEKRIILAFLAGILFAVLVAAVLGLFWVFLPTDLPAETTRKDVCTKCGIDFDLSSITYIYQNPEKIIEDTSLFWTEDSAYKLVAMGPQHRGKSLPPEGWINHINNVLTLSDKEREEEKPLARSVEIIEHADTFCQNALPVISSLLPDEADLSTTIYLTAFNDPSYFVFRGNLVMKTDWSTSTGSITEFFNILSHELFHIGYFDFQPYQTEVWSDFYPTKVLLTVLQNDGLAVYTQYLLSSLYPGRAEIDFLIIKNSFLVKILINRVNGLLQETDVLSINEAVLRAFTGKNQRALYMVGAYMAQTIDENLGREALVETVRKGPRSFITTYNTVAKDGMEIYEIPEPEELSAVQVLRQAAIQGDINVLTDMINAIKTSGIEDPGGAIFEHLESTGLLLLKKEQSELAVEVFQLMVMLFPDHPYSYLHLGDAYTQNEDIDEAEEAYLKALEIDPRVAPVIRP
jgi:hypothetical protein